MQPLNSSFHILMSLGQLVQLETGASKYKSRAEASKYELRAEGSKYKLGPGPVNTIESRSW